jgi:formylglycine-generating enzyme required for sulfatase activity
LIALLLSLLLHSTATPTTGIITASKYVVTPTPQPLQSSPVRNTEWTPVVQEFDSVEMVSVPSGCFILDRPAQTVPEYEVCIDQPFWIDRMEVSYEQLQPYLPQMLDAFFGPGWKTVDMGRIAEDQREPLFLSQLEPFIMDTYSQVIPNLPPRALNWQQAKSFCELRGGRLPTSIEWEYAARGPEKWLYPWGNMPDDTLWASFNTTEGRTVPVDSYPEGASWVGALNMMGNVSEYTSTLETASQFTYPYNADDGREDLNTVGQRIIRGTNIRDRGGDLREETTLMQNLNFTEVDEYVGIRCARSSDGTEVVTQPAEANGTTEGNTATGSDQEGFETVEINASDQRRLVVAIPAGWSQEVPSFSTNRVVTSNPEAGQFNFYAPVGTADRFEDTPELRFRVVPYTNYEDICIALTSLNTDYRQGARYSFSGSVCDTFDTAPTTQIFGQTEWLTMRYVIAQTQSLAVTVGKGLVIEVALLSVPEEHDELLATVLTPALNAISFELVEGEGTVGLPPPPLPYGPACTPGGKPTRLYVGGQGRPVSLVNKPIFEAPGASLTSADRIAWIAGVFTVLEGPVCVDGTAFYRIDNNGLIGWIRETSSVPGSPADYDVDRVPHAPINASPAAQPTQAPAQELVTNTPLVATTAPSTPTLIPTATPTPTQCDGNLVSRLIAGQPGRVTPGDANNLRDTPSRSGELLGQIPGSGEFMVIGGPTCADGLTWVQVDYSGVIGWTVEATSDEYWLEPLP